MLFGSGAQAQTHTKPLRCILARSRGQSHAPDCSSTLVEPRRFGEVAHWYWLCHFIQWLRPPRFADAPVSPRRAGIAMCDSHRRTRYCPSWTLRYDADSCYQLLFPGAVVAKPVHGLVQDEQQCELCFRVERCGRPALPCAPCYASIRIRSHAAADSGSNGAPQLMCDLFRLRGAVIATEVHWHCGDAREAHVLIGTHPPHAKRRRSIPCGLTVARQESPRLVIGKLPRSRLPARNNSCLLVTRSGPAESARGG